MRARIDEMQARIGEKAPEMASDEEYRHLQAQLDEIHEKMTEKANKTSVAQALHKKANR
jgi:tetrahydromethanopterin S-methyltransferase subunit G